MSFKYPIIVLLWYLTLAGCTAQSLNNAVNNVVKNLPSVFQGEARVALVIGNEKYQTPQAWAILQSPINDASKMKQALEEMGFDVIYRENANQHQMEGAIREFKKKLEDTDPKRKRVGLIYYSGHGIEAQGNVCLVAVDAPNLSSSKATSRNLKGFVPLASIYKEINQLNQNERKTKSLFFLDNCRSSPNEKELLLACNPQETSSITQDGIMTPEKVNTKGKKGVRWVNDGNSNLSSSLNSPGNSNSSGNSKPDFSEPDNSLTAYATRKYKNAKDGITDAKDDTKKNKDKPNSPYTRLLLERIKTPVPVEEILKEIGKEMDNKSVMIEEGVFQKPTYNNNGAGEIILQSRSSSSSTKGF